MSKTACFVLIFISLLLFRARETVVTEISKASAISLSLVLFMTTNVNVAVNVTVNFLEFFLELVQSYFNINAIIDVALELYGE